MKTLRQVTGGLLMLVPIAFTVLFTLLQMYFEYPDILRQPTADILQKFQAGGPNLIAMWYGLVLTAILFIPIVVCFHRVLATEHTPTILWVASAFGIVAGLVQALGFLRWPFIVPYLADTYLDPLASEAQRAAAAMVFEAFHRYAGMGVGEQLGYLSTSVWTILIGLVMLQQQQVFGRWLGLSGVILAIGVASGLLEPAGVPLVGAINAISYLAWALWLVVVGLILVIKQPLSLAAARQGA